MKRHVSLLACLVLVVAMVFTLASCDQIKNLFGKPECTEHVDANTDYVCDNCGAELEKPAEHTHEYSSEVTTAATCTADGVKTFTCSCGDSYTEAIPATGHTDADTNYVCDVCEAELEGKPEPEPVYTKVYLDNNAGWEKVYYYCWNDAGDNLGTWPGVELTAGADGLYSVDIPEGYTNVIFNNNNGVQTADLKVPTDEKVVFDNVANAWTTYDLGIANTVAVGENKIVYVDGYTYEYTIFAAPVDGTYTFSCAAPIAIYVFTTPYTGEAWDATSPNWTVYEWNLDDSFAFVESFEVELTAGYYWIGLNYSPVGQVEPGSYTINVSYTEPAVNELEVTTSDTYGYFDLYSFTAAESGTYTFTLPSGLGFCSKAQYDAWGEPEVDVLHYAYDAEAAHTVEVGLAAGANYEFYVGAETKADWIITWTFVAGEVGGDDPVDPDPTPANTNLVLGDNTISVPADSFGSAGTYTLVVENAGTYTFASNDVLAIINFADGSSSRGEAYLEAGTYTINVVYYTTNAGDYNLNVSYTAPSTGGDESEADGSENNPYPVTSLDTSVTADGDSTNKIFYTFIATADGTLTITYSTANSWITITDKTDTSLNDSTYSKDVNTFTLVSGHEYVLGLGVWTAEETDPSVTLSFVEGSGGTGDTESCNHNYYQDYWHADTVTATCVTGGVNVFVCEYCGDVKTETTAPDTEYGHDYVTNMETYKAATCVADGYREATCSFCSDHKEYVLSADEYGYHAWVLDETTFKEPTCQTAGYAHSSCSVCGEQKTEEEPASDWYHVNEFSSNYSVTTCTVCGKTTLSLYVDATETTYGLQLGANYMGVAYISIWNSDYSVNDAFGYTATLADGVYTLTLNNMYENNDTLGLLNATITVKPVCTGLLVTITPAEGEAVIFKNYENEHVDNDGDFLCDGGCKTVVEPAADSVLTIEQALALGKLFAAKTYTTNKYYVSGTINNVYNTTYGNMYIKDADGKELCIYGSYDATGANRYDAMSIKHVAGDTVTVYGQLTSYNGVGQMSNGWVTVESHEHAYADATCTAPKTCACGATDGELAAHTYVNGVCSVCSAVDPDYEGEVILPTSFVFDFGANSEAKHVDGSKLTSDTTYSVNGVDLTLTSMTNVYGSAYDATGNSCLKLGTSSGVASFTFTVGEDVDKVIIYVAKYKANTTKITINGGDVVEIPTASNDGAYTAVEIDTTTTKTITFATVSGACRAMINAIELQK